jgi:membrane dipeptidase
MNRTDGAITSRYEKPSDLLSRRRALNWLAAGIGGAMSTAANAADILISDTHSHIALRLGPSTCLGCGLTESGVSLMSWALASDGPFLQRMPNGSIQANSKPSVDQFREVYMRMLGGMQRRIRGENLRLVLNPDHVDLALQGQLHIVLSTEGAHFLGGDVNYLDVVYAQGVRQIGLGHFIEGDLLDIRTESPKIGGLSDFGRSVIARCNALGIVVDLAHSTDQAVSQALEVSKQPMLWSHSAISSQATDWRSRSNHIMSVSLANAKTLAQRGGVIGMWPSKFNFNNPRAYVEALGEAVSVVGEDHVAFGTDMQGLAPQHTMLENYAGMREIVNLMLSINMPEATVRKVAGQNYGRLLKTVLLGRTL